jgi:CheY-like chemotaxis protein
VSHLLIVDDDLEVLALLKKFFLQHGYTVETAANGAELWAAMERTPADLIILDEFQRFKHLLVGGLSGHSDEALALSEDRSTEIPRDGMQLEARSANQVVILRDTVRVEDETVAETVQDLLDAHRIELGEHDVVTPEPDTELSDGMVVSVLELLSEPETEEVEIEADYHLNYEYVIRAVSACTGRFDENTQQIVRYVDKIKFAPPQRPE